MAVEVILVPYLVLQVYFLFSQFLVLLGQFFVGSRLVPSLQRLFGPALVRFLQFFRHLFLEPLRLFHPFPLNPPSSVGRVPLVPEPLVRFSQCFLRVLFLSCRFPTHLSRLSIPFS